MGAAKEVLYDNQDFSLELRQDLRCIKVKWCNNFSAQTCSDFFSVLKATPYFRHCEKIFHDARDADLRVSSTDVGRIAKLGFVERDPTKELRIAFVANSDVSFGVLRMIAAMRSVDGRPMQVFRALQDAADWLDLPAETLS